MDSQDVQNVKIFICLIICMICFGILAIQNAIKAWDIHKRYIRELFEWNKGRLVLPTHHNTLEKCYNHIWYSLICACVDLMIYSFL